ncbi:hypothetical protein [Lichenicoccus sp.]|uniref:hypothetical protein n=1 Tax=Lichenicoccus sp. TaxID=2781899 RepID=UPI003D105FFC
MQSESRTGLVLDLADMMSGLPPAVAGGIAGGIAGLAGGAPRQNRRLPERILVAAHQACDLGDLDVAAQLLTILETVIGQTRGSSRTPTDPARRRVMESLIAAHQRLWHLRHADTPMSDAAAASTRPATMMSSGLHEAPETFGMGSSD